MSIDIEKINEMLEHISKSGDIQLSDIPCIDLYMDQVTTLFEDKLANYKRESDEKILTKTMINNYTKAKALMPPKNKKYSKEHIILMSLIYNLKQVLSLNDIKLVLTPVLNKLNTPRGAGSNLLDEFYSSFLQIKANDMKDLKGHFLNAFDLVNDLNINIEGEDKDLVNLMLLVLTLTSQAAMQKRLAECIIDTFFKTNGK